MGGPGARVERRHPTSSITTAHSNQTSRPQGPTQAKSMKPRSSYNKNNNNNKTPHKSKKQKTGISFGVSKIEIILKF